MRKEWINEGKPRDEEEDIEHLDPQTSEHNTAPESTQVHSAASDNTRYGQTTPNIDDEDNLHSATPPPVDNTANSSKLKSSDPESLFLSDDDADDQPPEDDLDALLAEGAPVDVPEEIVRLTPVGGNLCNDQVEANFDAEMEVLAGFDYVYD